MIARTKNNIFKNQFFFLFFKHGINTMGETDNIDE